MINRWHVILISVVTVAVITLLTWKPGFGKRTPPPEFKPLLREIMSVESATRAPIPDPSGSTLACLSGNEHGRGLYFIDLKTLQRTTLPFTNDIRRVEGWSPDGKYLVFEQKPYSTNEPLAPTAERPLAEDRSESWLTIYDREANTIQRLTSPAGEVNERGFVWLTTNTYLFSRDADYDYLKGTFWGRLNSNNSVKVAESFHDFVVMTEHSAAYLAGSRIYNFALDASINTNNAARQVTTNQLSAFDSQEFDSLRWLHYQPEKEKFLFCSRPTNSTWRYLFEFNPTEKQLVQLNHEDTYNGQWLEAGAGYAYVGNTNNSFFLAVRTKDPAGHTNLFTKGSVGSYTTSLDGDKLYATASLGMEPQGIWEYALKERTLRQIAPGNSKPFVETKISEPREERIKSFDGLEIPCFTFQPLRQGNLSDQKTSRHKYPAVIYLPARTFQFQRTFEPRSQLMSNLGFYFMAVNYRGCDGYGRDYANWEDPASGAKDVLAAYEELIKNPEVDRENVFLLTTSSGGLVALELLASRPESWRGVVLTSPPCWQSDPRFNPEKFPALLVTTGEKDEARPSLKGLEKWISNRVIDAKLVVLPSDGHIVYSSAGIEMNLKLMTEFIFSHLKE